MEMWILKYAEDGAMMAMARRSDVMRKHNYAPDYVENFERSLNDLKKIREMIDRMQVKKHDD